MSFIKSIAIIDSCVTLEQLQVAEKYIALYFKTYIKECPLISKRISYEVVYPSQFDLLDRRILQRKNEIHGSVVERNTR